MHYFDIEIVSIKIIIQNFSKQHILIKLLHITCTTCYANMIIYRHVLDMLSKKRKREIHQTRDSMLFQIESGGLHKCNVINPCKKLKSFIFKNIFQIFFRNGTRLRMPDF